MEGGFMANKLLGSPNSSPSHLHLDLQHRVSNPAYHAHSGPRPPDQEAPLNSSPPMRSPLMVVAHQGKGPSISEEQESLRFCHSKISEPTKDESSACFSSSSPFSSVKIDHTTQNVFHEPMQRRVLDPLHMEVSFSEPLHCISKHSQGCSGPIPTHQQSKMHPKHFLSPPNSWQEASPTFKPQGDCHFSPQPHQNSEFITVAPHKNTFSKNIHFTPASIAHDRGCSEQTLFDYLKQSCQAQVPAAMPSHQDVDDAYQILQDQDRQLKFLQAQINKLLDSQKKSTYQLPSTDEVVIQTQSSPEKHARKKVNIAVETDPDNAPAHNKNPQQDCHAISEPGVPDANHLSLLEESRREDVEEEENVSCSPSYQSLQRYRVISESSCFQSPGLRDSASIHYQPLSPERENPARQETSIVEEEHTFYQQLLGQVNSCLQDFVNKEVQEEEVYSGHRLFSKGSCYESFLNFIPYCTWKPASSLEYSDSNQVLNATLQLLNQLAVCMELDSANIGKAPHKETTSTNPEAVMPRLTYLESIDTSLWDLSGSGDLSLEANAIAIKYLNDSQLTRLSLGSQHSPWTKLHSNVALLSEKPSTDISTNGLSLLSPNNMSIATKNYMRRYGLCEGNSSQEKERDKSDDVTQVDQVLHQKQLKGFLLKSMANERAHFSSPLFPQSQQLYSQSDKLRDMSPKRQYLNLDTKTSQKKNCAKQQSSLSKDHGGSSQQEQSVGNFLDLSRLRQLPKLF